MQPIVRLNLDGEVANLRMPMNSYQTFARSNSAASVGGRPLLSVRLFPEISLGIWCDEITHFSETF